LLLVVREGSDKSKFLCGFDERRGFAAAIPESASAVRGVASAKEALQPEAVREALAVNERDLLPDEPLTRGRGKDHMLEFAFRRGGETVFVNAEHSGGICAAEFELLSPPSSGVSAGGRWCATRISTRAVPCATGSHHDRAARLAPRAG
jgi:hypothetical protein